MQNALLKCKSKCLPCQLEAYQIYMVFKTHRKQKEIEEITVSFWNGHLTVRSLANGIFCIGLTFKRKLTC